jgi:autophagy-related protein 11
VAASFLETSHIHHEHVKHISLTLHYQHEAVRIESNSLDLHVLAITDIFEGIAASARRELEKQSALLAGLEADLEIIARVKIHVEFMSPGVRRAIESGEKPRTLGDYVSIIKMKQVAETCQRTHGGNLPIEL